MCCSSSTNLSRSYLIVCYPTTKGALSFDQGDGRHTRGHVHRLSLHRGRFRAHIHSLWEIAISLLSYPRYNITVIRMRYKHPNNVLYRQHHPLSSSQLLSLSLFSQPSQSPINHPFITHHHRWNYYHHHSHPFTIIVKLIITIINILILSS